MSTPLSAAGETPDFGPQKEAHAKKQVVFHWLGRAPNPGLPLKKDELPGVTSLGMWKAHHPQHGDANIPARIPEVQLCFSESRNATLVGLDGARHVLPAHALIATLPWEAYSSRDMRGEGHWINLDVGVTHPDANWRWPAWVTLTAADKSELEWRWRRRPNPVMVPTPEIRETFLRMGRAVKSHEAGGAHQISRLAVLINNLLWNMLQVFKDGQFQDLAHHESLNHQAIHRFWEKFDRSPERLAEAPRVAEMAAACGVSTTTFIAVTKALLGEAPVHRILSRRLAHGAALLRSQPERSVLDIALDCGFSSSQHFAACFGQRFGCTPTGWRQKEEKPSI